MCFSLQRRAIFRHPNFKKPVRSWGVLYILTCASRYRGVQFLDIWTSKKCSGPGVFCAFWLANVLLATAACNFSTSELQKAGPKLSCFVHFDLQRCFSLQRRAILDIWTSKSAPKARRLVPFYWKCASHLTACNFSFLLSTATSAPAALPSLLFDPADPQTIEKTQHFATSLTFRSCGSSFYWLSRNCSFFLLTLLIFSAFHLLTLLLCSAFSTVHIVGSWTSKLPLIINHYKEGFFSWLMLLGRSSRRGEDPPSAAGLQGYAAILGPAGYENRSRRKRPSYSKRGGSRDIGSKSTVCTSTKWLELRAATCKFCNTTTTVWHWRCLWGGNGTGNDVAALGGPRVGWITLKGGIDSKHLFKDYFVNASALGMKYYPVI